VLSFSCHPFVLLQVRRAVLRVLPKLPMLSSAGGPSGTGSSSLQYPRAELKPQAAAAPSAAAGACGAASQSSGQQQQAAEQQSLLQEASGNSSISLQELAQPLGPCPICSTSEILVPFVALPCRHVFCYYCLQSHCNADSDFPCPVDGVRVDALQRYVRTVPATTAPT
jgi:peroxin-2